MIDGAEIDENSPEKLKKIKRNEAERAIKHKAVLLLNENGFGPSAIAKAVGYHEKHVTKLLPKLRKESLSHPRKVKLASKCVEQVMSGFVGEKDENGQVITDPRVKASDALRAAELVYSRAEPVRQENRAANNQTFVQVNQNFINQLNETKTLSIVVDESKM